MPIVQPEKQLLEQQVQAAADGHFWGQRSASARRLDGLAPTLPCEPQPLSLCAQSGVSRVQFLAAVRAGTRVPAVPAYCREHGEIGRAHV